MVTPSIYHTSSLVLLLSGQLFLNLEGGCSYRKAVLVPFAVVMNLKLAQNTFIFTNKPLQEG